MENLLDSRRFYIKSLSSYFVLHFCVNPTAEFRNGCCLQCQVRTNVPVLPSDLVNCGQRARVIHVLSLSRSVFLQQVLCTRRHQELGRQISDWVSSAQVLIKQNSSFLLTFEVTIPSLKSFNYIYFIAGISTKC